MPKTDQSTTEIPTLSVVIPVYNDPEGVRTTLESLTTQTYPVEAYEILVVDNGSDDDTCEVVREYCDRYPELVTLLVEDKIQGSYAARNRGIEHAHGTFISFIDADMTADVTWLSSVARSMQEHGWMYMGCNVSLYTEHETLWTTYDCTLGFPVEKYIEHDHFAPTCCLVVRNAVFEEVGLFDGRLISGGDREFGNRVYDAGFELQFESTITLYHPARSSFRALASKKIRIGRGAVQREAFHPNRSGKRRLADPRNYLPPGPIGFYQRLSERETLQTHKMLLLFLLDYVLKLFRTGGRIYETFCNKSKTDEKI